MVSEIQSVKKYDVLKYLEGLEMKSSLVYMAGSIMEGFGNATSDIDVYVICDDFSTTLNNECNRDFHIKKDDYLIRNVIENEVRYDFEYYTWSKFDSLIDKINSLNFQTDEHLVKMSENDIDFLHRLKHGKPVVNEEKFNNIKKRVNFNNLSKYLVVVYVEKYDGFLEDLEGALESKDYGTAFILTRLLLEHSLLAYLAAYGETNPSRKWIYRKLKRYQENHDENTVLHKYMDLSGEKFVEEDIEEYSARAINFTQKLIVKAQEILK